MPRKLHTTPLLQFRVEWHAVITCPLYLKILQIGLFYKVCCYVTKSFSPHFTTVVLSIHVNVTPSLPPLDVVVVDFPLSSSLAIFAVPSKTSAPIGTQFRASSRSNAFHFGTLQLATILRGHQWNRRTWRFCSSRQGQGCLDEKPGNIQVSNRYFKAKWITLHTHEFAYIQGWMYSNFLCSSRTVEHY